MSCFLASASTILPASTMPMTLLLRVAAFAVVRRAPAVFLDKFDASRFKSRLQGVALRTLRRANLINPIRHCPKNCFASERT
jgi:hypothetical protein